MPSFGGILLEALHDRGGVAEDLELTERIDYPVLYHGKSNGQKLLVAVGGSDKLRLYFQCLKLAIRQGIAIGDVRPAAGSGHPEAGEHPAYDIKAEHIKDLK